MTEGFLVQIKIEKFANKDKNLTLCIKRNKDSISTSLAPMSKEDLTEIAKTIIDFLAKDK